MHTKDFHLWHMGALSIGHTVSSRKNFLTLRKLPGIQEGQFSTCSFYKHLVLYVGNIMCVKQLALNKCLLNSWPRDPDLCVCVGVSGGEGLWSSGYFISFCFPVPRKPWRRAVARGLSERRRSLLWQAVCVCKDTACIFQLPVGTGWPLFPPIFLASCGYWMASFPSHPLPFSCCGLNENVPQDSLI